MNTSLRTRFKLLMENIPVDPGELFDKARDALRWDVEHRQDVYLADIVIRRLRSMRQLLFPPSRGAESVDSVSTFASSIAHKAEPVINEPQRFGVERVDDPR
jgi:hypothetical protein